MDSVAHTALRRLAWRRLKQLQHGQLEVMAVMMSQLEVMAVMMSLL